MSSSTTVLLASNLSQVPLGGIGEIPETTAGTEHGQVVVTTFKLREDLAASMAPALHRMSDYVAGKGGEGL